MKKGESVSVDDTLLRRVYREDKRYRDPRTGRPSSRAFSPRPKDEGKLSVNIESMTSFESAIIDPIKFILYRISVTLVNELGLDCIYDPLVNGDFENLAHALVIGFDEEDESVPAILSRKAQQINYP